MGVNTPELVVACEMDVFHDGTRLRLPVRTTLRLSLALAGRLKKRTSKESEPSDNFKTVVPKWSETSESRDGRRPAVPGPELDEGESSEPGKDALERNLGRIPGEGSDMGIQDEGRGYQSSSPVLGHRRCRPVPQLRRPSVMSPAFWCPP